MSVRKDITKNLRREKVARVYRVTQPARLVEDQKWMIAKRARNQSTDRLKIRSANAFLVFSRLSMSTQSVLLVTRRV